MATVVTRYPQNLISSRSSWVNIPLKLVKIHAGVLGCGTPATFMPADATDTRTAQVTTIIPAFMIWGLNLLLHVIITFPQLPSQTFYQ